MGDDDFLADMGGWEVEKRGELESGRCVDRTARLKGDVVVSVTI